MFLTYLHGKARNTYICPMQECQNVSNTSRHQEVVVSLLNLLCYSYFSCLGNLKLSFRKIMIFATAIFHVLETWNARSEKLWFLQLWRYSSGSDVMQCNATWFNKYLWVLYFRWVVLCCITSHHIISGKYDRVHLKYSY